MVNSPYSDSRWSVFTPSIFLTLSRMLFEVGMKCRRCPTEGSVLETKTRFR